LTVSSKENKGSELSEVSEVSTSRQRSNGGEQRSRDDRERRRVGNNILPGGERAVSLLCALDFWAASRLNRCISTETIWLL
jgi:hypothetical protein